MPTGEPVPEQAVPEQAFPERAVPEQAVLEHAVLEHAVLDVVPGREDEFERAFAEAGPIIAGAAGCRSLRLERSLEHPSRYLLLVEWATLQDHTEGFRGSPGYQEWRRLLHHFYEPFPTVEHFVGVAGG